MNKRLYSALLGAALGLQAVCGLAAGAPDSLTISRYVVEVPEEFYVRYPGNNQTNFPLGFRTGFGSGLTVKAVHKDGKIEFYGITDRGPNADGPAYSDGQTTLSGKFFPSPAFHPEIAVISAKDGKATVTKTIELKNQTEKLLTGLPIPLGTIGATSEAALSEAMEILGYDADGLDSEGIALDKDGNFWVCDEYGPFIAQFDKTGKMLKKYAPGQGLPEVLSSRVPNRGFEGITVTPGGKVLAAIQSPLNIEGKTGKTALFTRIVELDPHTGTTKMYAYPIDATAYKSPKDAKIGDIYAISDTKLLLIEQGKGKDKQMRNMIYLVDLANASDLSNATIDGKQPEFIADKNNLTASIQLADKQLLVDLRAHGWEIEKAEGLCMLPDKKTIVITNDNDFGLSVDVADSDHPNTEVIDYTLRNNKNFTYKGKTATPSITLVPNDEKERIQYIWTIELSQPIE